MAAWIPLRARRLRMLGVLALAVLCLAAVAPASAATLATYSAWSNRTDVLAFTVTASSFPAGWTTRIAEVEDGEESAYLVKGDARIGLDVAVLGRPGESASIDARADAEGFRTALAGDSSERFAVVDLGAGAFGVRLVRPSDDGPERLLYVARRSRPDTLVHAALDLDAEGGEPALPSEGAMAEAEEALMAISESLDGFFGPDVPAADRARTEAGLGALEAAFSASRGTRQYAHYQEIIPTGREWLGGRPLPRGAQGLSKAFLMDYARRLQGDVVDGRLVASVVGRTISRYDTRRRCYAQGTGVFPPLLRRFGLFGEFDTAHDLGGTGSTGSFVDPAVVDDAYGLVFRPLARAEGKSRIEYLAVGAMYRWRVIVRLDSAGRIEAIRRERLDRKGAIVSASTSRIAYAISADAVRARPVCGR